MAPHEKRHLADKHPQDTQIPAALRKAVISRCKDQSISCAGAHAIAQQLNVAPAEVGKAMDLLACRILKCQLGLFGYHPQKKIVTPARSVSPALQQTIQSHLKNNCLSCYDAWQLAHQHGISRLDCSAACEALKIKVSPCQLGAF